MKHVDDSQIDELWKSYKYLWQGYDNNEKLRCMNVGYWDDYTLTIKQANENLYCMFAKHLGLMELAEDASFLDVGFGYGYQLVYWQQALGVRAKIFGRNIDQYQVDYARNLLTECGCPGIELSHGLAEELPYDDAQFERVAAIECVFHMESHRFFDQAFRVLKQGGTLAYSTIDFASSLDNKRMDDLVNDLRVRNHFPLLGEHHANNSCESDIAYLQKLGFDVQVIDFSEHQVDLFPDGDNKKSLFVIAEKR